MYFEVDDNNINMLVLEEEDICHKCSLKYDCPLICGLTSGFVVQNTDDDLLIDCNIFKGE